MSYSQAEIARILRSNPEGLSLSNEDAPLALSDIETDDVTWITVGGRRVPIRSAASKAANKAGDAADKASKAAMKDKNATTDDHHKVWNIARKAINAHQGAQAAAHNISNHALELYHASRVADYKEMASKHNAAATSLRIAQTKSKGQGACALSLSGVEVPLELGNPYHDEHGRFTSGDGDARSGEGKEGHYEKMAQAAHAASQKAADLDSKTGKEKSAGAAHGAHVAAAQAHEKAIEAASKLPGGAGAAVSDHRGIANKHWERAAEIHRNMTGSKMTTAEHTAQYKKDEPKAPEKHVTPADAKKAAHDADNAASKVSGANKKDRTTFAALDASDRARVASTNTRMYESGGGHSLAAKAHQEAAEKHFKAADHWHKKGDEAQAKLHADAANAHMNAKAMHTMLAEASAHKLNDAIQKDANKKANAARPQIKTTTGVTIYNPNSSGQGQSPQHVDNPHHKTITDAGYKYSHTTKIGHSDGTTSAAHSYVHPKNKDEVVGVHGKEWNVHTLGSGHEYSGKTSEGLSKMLKSRAKRRGL